MIFEIVLAILVLLVIYRKKVIRIADLPLRYPVLIFASFALQFLIVYLGGQEVHFFIEYAPFLYIFSFAILLWALYKNLHIKWMFVVIIGIFLNFLAITVNGGAMPVSADALETAGLHKYCEILQKGLYPTHTVMMPDDPLVARILGDFIPIVPPHPRPRVISIGDIIMTIGVVLVMFGAISKDYGQEGKEKASSK